jgi:AcrR family transcriptional regulator
MADETGKRTRAPRSDGIRNREWLVSAAQKVLAGEGLEAPLEHIAAEAGVGIATLYRNFPSRAELWNVVLEEPLAAQLAAVERALTEADAWTGLSEWIVQSCALEAGSDGFLNLMSMQFSDAPALRALRTTIQERIEALFDRALKAGAIRPDITVEDLLFITVSNSRILEVTREIAPTAWRRNVDLFLDSIRPERAHQLGEPPLKPAQVRRISRDWPKTSSRPKS